MRCNNCGWDNPDGLTRCEKCNTPLVGASYKPAQAAASQQPFGKTVNEGMVFPDAPATGQNVCPNCGYPMRPGVTICPNCHYGKTIPEPQPQFPQNPQPAPSTPAPEPKPFKGGAVKGTVNPWMQVKPVNKCVLEPLMLDGLDTPEALRLKGDAHELNRENLDPDNPTITSKTQAVISCEDDQWFIEDKSSQHTTFVYAGDRTPLKEGDVILMGNRQFIFHIEK